MAEPEHIFEEVLGAVAPQDLGGQRVLVTAGPTREGFDPVRFISNASSGKMGYALAREARSRGAKVCLVSGPTQLRTPHGVELVRVTTTQEMLDACRAEVGDASIVLMAAAPADQRPASYSAVKTKKKPGEDRVQIEMENTPDILVELDARQAGVSRRRFCGGDRFTGAEGARQARRKEPRLDRRQRRDTPGRRVRRRHQRGRDHHAGWLADEPPDHDQRRRRG